jgi:hypothetical protein
VIGAPPLLAGGAHRAVALTVPTRTTPDEAFPMSGRPGTVTGVTAADRADAGPVPTALIATTSKV